MKKILFGLIASFCFTSAIAQHNECDHDHGENITPYHDALDAKNGITGIRFNADPKWLAFLEQHPNWGAYFNAYNNMPHRAAGPGIATTGATAEQRALNFINTHLSQYKVPTAELQLIKVVEDKKYTNVNFKQVINGREVVFSRVTVRLTKTGEVVLFGMDVYNDSETLSTKITEAEALHIATESLPHQASSVVGGELKLMPVPIDGKTTLVPVYEFTITTPDEHTKKAIYYTLVDAHNGKVIYRNNKVVAVSATIAGPTKVLNNWSPTVYKGLPYVQMVVGANTYTANAQGLITVPGTTATGTINLAGPFSSVRMDATPNTVVSVNATITGGTYNFDTTLLGTSGYRPTNVYYHATYVHDFMKQKLGTSFTALDFPLPAFVDNTSSQCNAFFDGQSINFYAKGSICNATSTLADVIYHEYGHAITNYFWDFFGLNFNNGAMGEGYSDMWAMGITNHPVIGPGFYLNSSTTGIRQYNAAPKIYPQDIVGEVHADGEIIAGAWWDTYLNWGSLDSTSSLFADTHFGLANAPDGLEGQLYYDILLDALTYDDNDGNITNGTPHFLAIAKGFARHGIFLNMNATIEHTPLATLTPSSNVTISSTLTPQFPVFVGDVVMYYRRKPGLGITALSDSILMTNTGSFNYTCNYPGGVEGDIIEYYFGFYDNYYQLTPAGAARRNASFNITASQRNLPYYMLFGMFPRVRETFETGAPGWKPGLITDDATAAGRWIIATPVGSKINGNQVQTDKDHTTGTGKCAVTGNAAAANSGAGAADVDGGTTTLESPIYNLSDYKNPYISYYRWYSNSQGQRPRRDEIRVVISDNGTTWKSIDRTFEPHVGWARNIYRVKDMGFTVDLSKIRIRVYATDSMSTGSLVEAAFDDFEILDVTPPAGLANNYAIDVITYPNPANTILNTVLAAPSSGSLTLYNAAGAIVSTQSFNNTATITTNVANLASGIYSLRINIGDNNAGTRTIVITR